MSKKLYDHIASVNYMNIAHKIKQFKKVKQKPKNNGEK
jgi:hypothetical protein